MTRTIILAALLAALPAVAQAQTFELTIKNGFVEAMTGLSIAGGKVADFRQVPASATRTFSVTLPDGKCEARVSVSFADTQTLDVGKFDFCENDLLQLTF